VSSTPSPLIAVADHADVPVDSIHGNHEAAERLFAELASVGLDYGDAMRRRQGDGVPLFEASGTR
jgi:transaldolase